MSNLFSQQLQGRVSRSGSEPLITYYDERTGERIELSGISFANWVHKTANLLIDEILIEPGDPIALKLAQDAPAHWTTLVWVAAIWRVGCPVSIGPESGARLEVVGPDAAFDTDHDGPVERVACALHPLGLGFDTPLPADVLDFGTEVHGQPDAFTGPLPPSSAMAWIETDQRLAQADVAQGFDNLPRRRMMVSRAPSSPVHEQIWPVVRRALVEPVITGGSVVIMVGGDAARRQSVADAERASRQD